MSTNVVPSHPPRPVECQVARSRPYVFLDVSIGNTARGVGVLGGDFNDQLRRAADIGFGAIFGERSAPRPRPYVVPTSARTSAGVVLPREAIGEAPAAAVPVGRDDGPPVRLPTGEGPPVFIPPVAAGESDGTPSDDHGEAVFPPGSIFAPGQVWGPDNRPDDFPETPPAAGSVILPPANPGIFEPSGGTVAADWGDFIQGTLQSVISGYVRGGVADVPSPSGVPAQVTVDTRTGAVTACRRRRRRRLVTPTDISDLAALQALVGKGSSAMNLAVAKAVRR